MSVEERRSLFARLTEVLGDAHAVTLIDQFPPAGHDVATRQQLDERFASLEASLRGDMDILRNELREEMAELRRELWGEMGQVRGEMGQVRGEMGQVRGEMAELRSQLHAEMAELRGELRAEVAVMRDQLRGEMAELRVDVADRLARHTRVTVGAVAALNAAMVGVVLTAISLL